MANKVVFILVVDGRHYDVYERLIDLYADIQKSFGYLRTFWHLQDNLESGQGTYSPRDDLQVHRAPFVDSRGGDEQPKQRTLEQWLTSDRDGNRRNFRHNVTNLLGGQKSVDFNEPELHQLSDFTVLEFSDDGVHLVQIIEAS